MLRVKLGDFYNSWGKRLGLGSGIGEEGMEMVIVGRESRWDLWFLMWRWGRGLENDNCVEVS